MPVAISCCLWLGQHKTADRFPLREWKIETRSLPCQTAYPFSWEDVFAVFFSLDFLRTCFTSISVHMLQVCKKQSCTYLSVTTLKVSSNMYFRLPLLLLSTLIGKIVVKERESMYFHSSLFLRLSPHYRRSSVPFRMNGNPFLNGCKLKQNFASVCIRLGGSVCKK